MIINTFKYYEELKPFFGEEGARKLVELVAEVYQNLANVVTKEEFKELRETVQQLAEAQGRTEARLEKLAEAQRRTEAKVEQLAEAQRLTEERMNRLEEAVQRLAEAQRRTEERIERLEEAVQRLAEAQCRTEERIDRLEETVQRLAEAQCRTEERIDRLEETVQRLAEAQCRTEEELRALATEHRKTREQLGGLSMTIGYVLENEAFKALPELLKKDHGLVVEGRLKRDYLKDKRGRAIEVNILGRAKRDGEEFTILGEAKSQLSKGDIDRFIKRKLKPLEEVLGKVFPILVTHMVSSPEVKDYAAQMGIPLYFSYEF